MKIKANPSDLSPPSGKPFGARDDAHHLRTFENRCLGATNLSECYSDNFPKADPERALEEARHCPETSLGILTDKEGKEAWLAVIPEGYKRPILLMKWPVIGRLDRESGGLATFLTEGQRTMKERLENPQPAGPGDEKLDYDY